ncbi:Uncharacterised protein [Mycobacteroides abscessus subsp. bolletii]|uniref:Shedu anti-phage system protein SduA domain-containing protein n=1 Tax=Mycobacteroides abscessus TaxID=36809 RepID=UPI00092B1BC8|nr:Shedu anti-phage system protein SduA domain-containing protein [Mycobacteroides abscessus]SIJ03355.1 Uncharacterised protein [Mycobacteroides abscessus subsp. bolletii]SLD76748.1 Uncharacterised protein [Mycobacteroides abscessus subsp. bolletii]SLD83846.1 Uncharacterised protein [Mycobacteroides abscessus subsp. bolletii]
MALDDFRAGLKSWRDRASTVQNCLWRDGIELKEKGQKYKSVGLSYFGHDKDNPSGKYLELQEAVTKSVGFGYDFDNLDNKFTLENAEIDVLKSFLNDKFDEDGIYVRVDSPTMAAEIKKQLSTYSPETLADILSAISDKVDLVRAIQKTGHADFLASYMAIEKNTQTLVSLKEAAADPSSLEIRFQKILQKNPWMFGSQFIDVAKIRKLTVLDELDIILLTGDGSIHIVELKKANIEKMVVKYRNHYIVGDEVHQAVSQTLNYLKAVDEEAHTIKSKLEFEAHRIFATVVIGHVDHNKADIAAEEFYRSIRTYNSHLTRVQVTTYDQLIKNAQNTLLHLMDDAEVDKTADIVTGQGP